MIKSNAEYIFEASWEVCNKVGGIYTVIKSKAEQMMHHYKNYCLIGPYYENKAKVDFKPIPTSQPLTGIFDALKAEGIICHYGVWDEIIGKPEVILIDFNGLIARKNEIKGMYWNDYRIDSLRGYWDFEEPMLWSYATGRLLEELSKHMLSGRNVVAHFHEWLSAFGLLYIKKHSAHIATVFTTHATTLGRTLAGNGRDLYAILATVNPEEEAYRYCVEAKHLTEKAAAQATDVFTTVSQITAIESEHFLGRKAEVLVLNGLDIGAFPSFEETSLKHITSRDKMRDFLTYYFFPYYSFDIDHNLIFYTVGRYEFHNKGYDLIIRALGKLNQMLKDENLKNGTPIKDQRTISMIFWIPMEQQGLKMEVLENKNYYTHIKNYINSNAPEILKRLTYDFLSKRENVSDNLFTEGFLHQVKKDLIAFQRRGYPPLSTHNIRDENNNELVRFLRDNGLQNRPEDAVKVIIEPVYLDGNDGFIDLAYYDAMAGCHLGLFPSYYEPWGYTPLESAALGVPALTSDLSGYGMFLKNALPESQGVYVLDRFNKPENYVIERFTKMLFEFAKLDHPHRVELKLSAKETAALADWKIFVEYYVQAHNMALENAAKALKNVKE